MKDHKTKKHSKHFKFEIIGVILITALFSCENNISDKKSIDKQVITTQKDNILETKNIKPTKFYIKDETKYSKNFISEFKKYHGMYETVSLIDDTIIVNNDRKELIIIPTDLPLNKTIIYEKTEKEKEQILTVRRVNFSTLEYNYYEIVDGKKTNERKGKADLDPTFYNGAEGVFEDENENTYGMNKYIDYSEKGCWTYIYVGVGSIEKSFLIHGCETGRNEFSTPELIRRK